MKLLDARPSEANGATPAQHTSTALRDYVDRLRASGVRTYPGANATYWVSSPERVVRRLPTFHSETPERAEVDRALTATGGLLANYVTAPDEERPANAWLYLCSDRSYDLRGRSPAMQRNVRRALRELQIAPLSAREVLGHGYEAYADTRRRAGLDDGTLSGFLGYFESRLHDSSHVYLGAWRNGHLAAFVTIVRIDDWAELGSFSMDSMLPHRPNDGLMYAALSTYMRDCTCRVVSFGVSSIQRRSNAAGLHRFKVKVGFDPIPVHRAFVLHPSLRAIDNRLTLTAAAWTVNGALRLRPRNRRLKKLGGVLGYMLGTRSMSAAEAT